MQVAPYENYRTSADPIRAQIWRDYEESSESAPTNGTAEAVTARKEYVDIVVSDVRSDPSFSFAVQLLQPGGMSGNRLYAIHLLTSASQASCQNWRS
jgi:hypothetical protein